MLYDWYASCTICVVLKPIPIHSKEKYGKCSFIVNYIVAIHSVYDAKYHKSCFRHIRNHDSSLRLGFKSLAGTCVIKLKS